jgi:hypothetical protein
MMIRHTVFFKLKHAAGSTAESKFFADSKPLETLPTVKNFERLKQTSKKANFDWGFAMSFEDQAAYDEYNNHPVHVAYVKDIWIPNVEAFQEIDYVKVQ